jgi:hypothetical protein
MSARKTVVSIVVVVLCVYFLAGLVGVLPYQYDIIKRGATSMESTESRVEVSGWKEAFTIQDGSYAKVMGVHAYRDVMYVFDSKPGGLCEIWGMDSTGVLDLKWSGTFTAQIDFCQFIDYYDSDGTLVMYCVLSNGYGAPSTYFYGTYNGEIWQTHTINPKFMSEISDHCDAIATNGHYLCIGTHRLDSTTVRVFNSVSWKYEPAKQLDVSYKIASAIQTYTSPSTVLPVYTTFYVAITGDSIVGDASIYFLDSSNHWTGIISLHPYYEVEVSAMTVYNESLWMGTKRGSFYSWSYESPAVIQPYATPISPGAGVAIKNFGVYSESIYAGAGQAKGVAVMMEGDIYKYNGDWAKDYNTDSINMYGFTVYGLNFYAGADFGKVYVYYERTIYDAPVIIHSPVSKSPTDTAIPIEARVGDSDGVNSVVLSYQVEGELLRTKSMNIVAGSGEEVGGKWVNGTYKAEIPPVSQVTNVTYYITATDNDGNTTQTSIYIIKMVKPNFLGVDLWWVYLLAIGLTLGIGYVASGRKKE